MAFCRGGPSSPDTSQMKTLTSEAARMPPTALEKSLAQRTGAGVCVLGGAGCEGDEMHKGSQFEAQID